MTKTIESSLSGDPFLINPMACSHAAQVLKKYTPPEEEHVWSKLPASIQLEFKIAFVSVCHAFNWDFLQDAMAHALLGESGSISSRLATLTARDFSSWVKDYPKQERVRASERSKLLRNVGSVMLQRWGGDPQNMLLSCQSRLSGDGGLLFILDGFDAFSADPLRKKSQVLAHDLLREGIIKFVDEDKITPAIDYHIMRSYLRTGRVVPRDPAVNPFLAGHPNPRPRLVKKLREAVAEAAELTAFYAGISVPDLNYVEWQLGRVVCAADRPNCEHVPIDRLPYDIGRLVTSACPFAFFCEARLNDDYQMYREPVFDKGYY